MPIWNLSLNISYSEIIFVAFVTCREKFRESTLIKPHSLSSKYFRITRTRIIRRCKIWLVNSTYNNTSPNFLLLSNRSWIICALHLHIKLNCTKKISYPDCVCILFCPFLTRYFTHILFRRWMISSFKFYS